MAGHSQYNCVVLGYASIPIPSCMVLEQQQQQSWQQSPALCFELRGSPAGRVAAAPFARLTSTQQGRFSPQELFSLSRLSDSISSELPSSSTSLGSSSGYESDPDTDTGYSSDLHLDRINCQICRRPLNERPGKKSGFLSLPWGSSSGSSSKGPSSDFLVCDCCQRCYHKHCCKQKGISTRERGGVWFHDSSCQDCQQKLQDKVAAGAAPLSGGRSWQLIDCAPVDPSGPGGVKALQALKQHLSDVLEVMLPAFGPGAAQQLVDTNKGYAVLLKKGKEPLTAGLMDVYGKEMAVLDLVATAVEHKGDGHCRTLLAALEGWLGPELGVAKLVAVCPADEARNLAVWQDKFGFRKLSSKALKDLQSTVPALNYYEDSTLLAKPLKKQQGSGKQQQQKHSKQAAAKDQPPGQQEGPAAASLAVEPLKV